jgi:hypothetical protein
MSVLDDFRKFTQDFLGPELRAINTRLDGMEKLNEVRFEALRSQMQTNHEAVMRELATDKRLSRLEDRLAAQQPAQ